MRIDNLPINIRSQTRDSTNEDTARTTVINVVDRRRVR